MKILLLLQTFIIFIQSKVFIKEFISDPSDGPCVDGPLLSIPNSVLGGASIENFTKLTIQGWFKIDSSIQTNNNILWMVGGPENTLDKFVLTVVYMQEYVKIMTCRSHIDIENDCIYIELTTFNSYQTSNVWVSITGSIDITNNILFVKMIQHVNSQSPNIYTKVQTFDFEHEITTLENVVLKNKVNNYFNLDGYCGQYVSIKWYAGWFTTSAGLDYDIHAQLLIHWKLNENPINQSPTDLDFTKANNNVNSGKDIGQMGSSTVVPPEARSSGIRYEKNEKIIFNGLKSLFGDDFMISFWIKTVGRTIDSPDIGVFRRVNNLGSNQMQIRLLYGSSKNKIKVSIKNTNADPHGAINFDNDQYRRILIAFYKHRKYQTTFFSIVSPDSFYERNIQGNTLYEEQYNDIQYIGDHMNFANWEDSTYVYLRDFRIYSGTHFIYENTEQCALYISEILPSCLYCTDTSTDPHDMCQEAADPEVSSRIDCPGRTYDNGSGVDPCQQIEVDGCYRGTSTTCSICEPPDEGSTCTVSEFPLCTEGMLQCDLTQYNNDDGLVNNLSGLSCKDKYYKQQSGSVFNCLECDTSCNTCSVAASCDTCPDEEFIQFDQLCAVGCGTDFEDHVNRKCVVECDINYNVLDDGTYKQCVIECPDGYVLQGRICQAECDAAHYVDNKVCYPCAEQCAECDGPFNIQCSKCTDGNYLEVSKCETFCADSTKILDQTIWECVAECPLESQQLGYYCINACPLSPVVYVEHFGGCIDKCPDGYIAKLEPNDDGVERYLCKPCYENCSKCFDEVTTDADGKPLHNCYVCTNNTFNLQGNCEFICKGSFPIQNEISLECVSACPAPLSLASFDGCTPPGCDYCAINCPPGKYEDDGECVTDCSANKFPTDTGYCISCSEECLVCHGAVSTMCDECRPTYYLVGTTCTNNCPSNLPFKDKSQGICVQDCAQNQYKVVDGIIYECLDACPATYTVNELGNNYYECISGCPIGKYELGGNCELCAPECLRCESNQNSNCTRCADGFYLDGRTCDTVCKENPNFYKQDYYYNCVETCDPTLYTVTDLLKCMSSCPADTHFRFGNECLTDCPDLYYKDLGLRKCEKCAGECTECFGPTRDECYTCISQYYLQDQTCTLFCAPDRFQFKDEMKCLQSCPDNYFSDDDGAGNKNCFLQCPSYKFALDFKCYFTCPDGYYNNSNAGECTLCTIECLTCNGPTNYDCIKCQTDFYFNDLQACIGDCPSSTFYNGESCQLCSFRCLECEINKFNCKECRGDRLLPLCLCEDGYFDDGIHSECQECIAPCITCQSLQICDSCPYNTSPPTCTCKRMAPIQTEWCISCTVAFPNIQISDDLVKLLVSFTYEVSINSDDPFYSNFNNCEILFSFQTLNRLGEVPSCSVDVNNRSRILVNLGENAQIVPGEAVHFNIDGIEDVSTTQCKDQYFSDFRTNKINPPINIVKSDIILYYPETKWNVCLPFEVIIIKELDNGLRSLNYDSWKLISGADGANLDNINQILQGAKKKVTFQSESLQQFTTYKFEITFTNFLLETNTKQFTIETIDNKSPIILIEIDYTHSYHANEENIIPFIIKSFDCSSGSIIESDDIFQSQITITDLTSGTEILTETRSIQKIDRENQEIKLEPFTTQPEHEYQIKITVKSGSKQAENSKVLFIDKTPISVTLLTPHRVISNKIQEFNIELDAYDPDVEEDEFKRAGLKYEWGCKNMGQNKACSYTDKTPIKMSTKPILTVQSHKMEVDFVFLFYCTVTKQSRNQIGNQYIIVTKETKLEQEPFVSNNRDDLIKLNPSNKLLIQAKQLISLEQAPWILIIYENILKGLIQMQEYTTPIFIYNHIDRYPGSDVVTVTLTKLEETQKFQIDTQLQQPSITINPRFGESLKDKFTITVTPTGFHYSYYVYFYEVDLISDRRSFNHKNGYLLNLPTKSSQLVTYLPSAIYNQQIHILVKVENVGTGNIAYVQDSLYVFAPEVTNIRRNVLRVQEQLDYITFEKTDKLLETYLSLLELYTKETESCFKECSGRGDCLENYRCNCDSEWFLSDCSGGSVDQDVNDQLLTQILQNLLENMVNVNDLVKKSFQLFMNLYNSIIYEDKFVESKNDIYKLVESILTEEEKKFGQSTEDTIIHYNETDTVNIIVSNQVRADEINIEIATTLINKLLKQNLRFYEDNTTNLTIKAINKQSKQFVDNLIELYFKGIELGQIEELKFDKVHIQIGRVYGAQLNKLNSLKFDTMGIIKKYITQPKTFVYKSNTSITLDQLKLEQQIQEQAQMEEQVLPEEQEEESQIINRLLENQESGEEGQEIILDIFSAEEIYDILLEVWEFNVLKFEKEFFYMESAFPIIKYQILSKANNSYLNNRELNIQYVFNHTQAASLDANLEGEEVQNIICIQQLEKEWDDEPCETNLQEMNSTGLIYCSCSNTTYVTVVNDYSYLIKPYYNFSNITMDKFIVIIILASLSLFMFIMVFVGRLRDNADWDKIKPQESGFAGLRRKGEVNDNLVDTRKKSVLITNLNMNVKRVNFGFQNKQKKENIDENNDLISQMIKQKDIEKEKEKNKMKQQAMINVWDNDIKKDENNMKSQWGQSIKFRKQKDQDNNLQNESQALQLEGQNEDQQQIQETPEQVPLETRQQPMIDYQKLEFRSNHHPKYFHKTHTLLAIIFRFRRFLSRPQRAFNLLARYLILFGFSGLIIEQQSLPFSEVVLIIVFIGFVHRIINTPLQYLNQQTDKPKGECQYKCFSFFITFINLVLGYSLVVYLYFFSNDDLLTYWILCFLYSGILELVLVDFLLQMVLFTKDYCAYSKQEAYQKALEDQQLENQTKKLYGEKQDSNEEINI